MLQNIMSENLNCQATFDTSFPLPQICKITLNDGKIIAEKCIQVEWIFWWTHTNKLVLSLKTEKTTLTSYFKTCIDFLKYGQTLPGLHNLKALIILIIMFV